MTWQCLSEEIAAMFAGASKCISWDDRQSLSQRKPLSIAYLERWDDYICKMAAAARKAADEPRERKTKRVLRESTATPASGLCLWCGELFDRAHSVGSLKYCNAVCARRHWLVSNPDRVRVYRRKAQRRIRENVRAEKLAVARVCELCGVTFHNVRAARFCSFKCCDTSGKRRRGLGQTRGPV